MGLAGRDWPGGAGGAGGAVLAGLGSDSAGGRRPIRSAGLRAGGRDDGRACAPGGPRAWRRAGRWRRWLRRWPWCGLVDHRVVYCGLPCWLGYNCTRRPWLLDERCRGWSESTSAVDRRTTTLTAAHAGVQRFGRGPFLLRQVGAKPLNRWTPAVFQRAIN